MLIKRLHFLKSHFFAGLLVLIPLGVIAWILIAALRTLWRVHELLPESLRPESFFGNEALATLFNGLITIGLTTLLAVGVSLLGWGSKHYLGQKVLELIGYMIQRIPVIRSVYSALDQLLRTLTAGGGQQFNRVVYIEYPRKGVWALAFVTGPAHGPAVPAGHLNVYIPTTPNPTSGFHLIVPENEVKESQMRVEDAFKVILSLGIAQPSDSQTSPRR
jgi:uncharacterized membrane protein